MRRRLETWRRLRLTDMSDRQISLFALFQAFIMALILVGLGAFRRGELSLLDAIAFVAELTIFFFVGRHVNRLQRDRGRRELEQRHGGDRVSFEAEHKGLRGFGRRMTGGPSFPGSRGFLLTALLLSLPLLGLGLYGLYLGHVFVPLLALGLGNVLVATGETLPERRRGLAVVLRMLGFLVWLVFVALALARILGPIA